MRNVEIKARVKDMVNLIAKVKTITPNEAAIIQQEDIFFNVPQGRLKLRKFENGSGELIHYERDDAKGPKLSNFEKANVSSEDMDNMRNVLSASLGVKTCVKKVRKLYLVGQTRIHVDNVENLGDFMELEVVLREDQTLEDGEKIALDLMKKLGVDQENLITCAYADLLLK